MPETSSSRFDIKTAPYFSTMANVFAIVFLVVGVLVVWIHTAVGLILITLCMAVLTTHYRLAIDLNQRTYHDYVWLMGMKHGEKGKFDQVEYLFIKEKSVSQVMNHQAGSTKFYKTMYDGYLRFSETHKLHIASLENKPALVVRLKVLANALGTEIVDYSASEQQAR